MNLPQDITLEFTPAHSEALIAQFQGILLDTHLRDVLDKAGARWRKTASMRAFRMRPAVQGAEEAAKIAAALDAVGDGSFDNPFVDTRSVDDLEIDILTDPSAQERRDRHLSRLHEDGCAVAARWYLAAVQTELHCTADAWSGPKPAVYRKRCERTTWRRPRGW